MKNTSSRQTSTVHGTVDIPLAPESPGFVAGSIVGVVLGQSSGVKELGLDLGRFRAGAQTEVWVRVGIRVRKRWG